MSKTAALQQLDQLYTAGFIDQEKYTGKAARLEQIATNNKMHYTTKNNRYLAVIEMAKHGM